MNPAIETLIIAAFLAFCRIGSCFMLMPGLSSARVAPQVRLFVAVGATFALLANLWDQIVPYVSSQPAVLAPLVASEILIGGLIGMLARIYMLAMSFIGTAVANLIGFTTVGGISVEGGEPQGPLGDMIGFAALMLLFVFNFHHEIVKALVQSYQVAPLNGMFNPRTALVDVTDTISEAFFIVLRLGSPFIAYAILINVTIGFVNKLTPQVPVYFISLPFVIAGGLILLYFGIGTMLSLFADGFLPTTIGR